MKALIADDEKPLSEFLQQRLSHLWPDLNICSIAANGLDAVKMIHQHQPDIVFLDIRMPGLNGLQVAQTVQPHTRIVFVTAFDQYAVEAFEHHAIDYLLKPVSDERLQHTIARLKNSNHQSISNNMDLSSLLQQLLNSQKNEESLQWIRVLIGNDVQLIHVDDIAYFKSGDKYTSVFTRDKEFLIRTPLKELETSLAVKNFWRIHRSVIINVQHLQSAKRTLDGRYILSIRNHPHQLSVSRAYAHLFKQM
ncbi:MAG: LytTR family DNA-binding domain-containing protein [Gammaproteobacteria bacterium]|nr:LytTR family DNA-binding domain-containing protein [Gammaproteobacteria bacterium]